MKPTLQETPQAKAIKPAYPSRRATIAGMPAFKGAEARRISEAVLSPLFPIKYTVFVIDASVKREPGKMLMGTIVCYLELEDWCTINKYDLVRVDGNPELALAHERTKLD